jgi:hypothetical protein
LYSAEYLPLGTADLQPQDTKNEIDTYEAAYRPKKTGEVAAYINITGISVKEVCGLMVS